ncbi:MAG: hypothetical protein ABI408_09930 [Gemmatimonadaceae bacterium]
MGSAPRPRRSCACIGRGTRGDSWQPLTKGLPQRDAYENVLRDALAADSFDSAGIYFGTRSGKLYGSRDEGTTWTEMADGLPPIVCVKTGTVGAA